MKKETIPYLSSNAYVVIGTHDKTYEAVKKYCDKKLMHYILKVEIIL